MSRLVLLPLMLAIAACSNPDGGSPPTTDATPVPATEPVVSEVAAAPAVKLYAMDCGELNFVDLDMFDAGGSMKGVARTFVDPCYLIRHPKGDLIWDTGVPEAIADMPDGLRPKEFPVHMVVKKKLSAQLAEIGLTPADIEFVSFSHMHSDHTGNGNLFAAATWIADTDERTAMFSESARKSEDFATYSALENAQTILIEGDATHDVFGDGSVVIHQTPGHTPGHTVLLIKTVASGAVVLAGDMWHLRESREKRLVPSFNFNREQTLASMDRVEALAQQNSARVVSQHVPEDFAALPVFPAALE